MPTVNDWIAFFTDISKSTEILKADYGPDYHDFEIKREDILRLLNLHKSKFSNEDIIIVRAPGRINLMGRHVDHQGGAVNLIAIDQEIFITAALREDLKIIAYNIDEKTFNTINFDLLSVKHEIHDDWDEIINSEEFLRAYRSPKGNWDNYIKAAYLRLVNLYGKKNVSGANLCVSGNIMIAAGLSSSSALTVGIFHALSGLNMLELKNEEIINFCAEAEWFVGTRGGSADQIAIKLARNNKIAHVKLFPLKIHDWIEFPQNCELLIFNSQIIADKSGSKKDIFNERILAYDIGFHPIKMKFPQLSPRLLYLRDINPENLDINSTELIKILLELPEYVNFNDLPNVLGSKWDEIKKKYYFNEIPQVIPVRKVIAYGIFECERSRIFYQFIRSGNILSAGKLMNISHNGDRVLKYNYKEKYQPTPYNNEMGDAKLKTFIQNNTSLEQISGGYGCSIPEIDFIIDVSLGCKGVLGAQLSGAGMGGCAMIFVKKEHSAKIMIDVCDIFSKRFKKPCLIYKCKPVKGISIYDHI